MKLNNVTQARLSQLFYGLLFIALMGASEPEASNYFLFPINPGQRGYLSGNFGELRSNHFHAGIDIKTGGRTGLPVYAAANGYVSRIKVSTSGYGNALYVQHPNGNTTVYAHLREFNEEIEAYVEAEQYRRQRFEVEMFPDKGELAVKKGKPVGKSGNSGSSGGPHLHFEIRNSRQQPLDPLQFRFSEFVDNIPPLVRKIALVTLDKDSRINGAFGRFEFPVRYSGGNYVVKQPIHATGRIGIEMAAYDQANGVGNLYGINRIRVKQNGQEIFYQHIDKFSFSQSRQINVHINYANFRKNGTRRFFKLYLDKGNQLPFYKVNGTRGSVVVPDKKEQEIEISLNDHYDNERKVSLTLIPEPAETVADDDNIYSDNRPYYVQGNILKLYAPFGTGQANFYLRRMPYSRKADYVAGNKDVYLWNVNQGIPDSVVIQNETIRFPHASLVPGKTDFKLYGNRYTVHFPDYALFDTTFVEMYHQYDSLNEREVFHIHEDLVPLKGNYSITLKPEKNYPDKNRTAIYAFDEDNEVYYQGGEWQGNEISLKTRYFGNYTLLTDTVAPEIRPTDLQGNRISFKITDKLSGVDTYEGRINGEWVLMVYDAKNDYLWSKPRNSQLPLKGNFTLKVTDNAGNSKTIERALN